MAFWNPKNQFDLKPTRRQSHYFYLFIIKYTKPNPLPHDSINNWEGGGGGTQFSLPSLSLLNHHTSHRIKSLSADYLIISPHN